MQFLRFMLISLVTALLLNSWALSTGSITPALNFSKTTLAKVIVTSSKTPTDSDRAYSFTITLPEQYGSRFAKISLTEQNLTNGTALLQFNLPATQAFLGTPTAKGRAILIEDTWVDETGTMWLEFKPSISPKAVLTLVFKPQASSLKGTHEYGIAAYPDTQYSIPIFVGNGKLVLE